MCLKSLLIHSHFLPLSPTLHLTPLPSLSSWICWRNQIICSVEFHTVWFCWLNPYVANMFSCLLYFLRIGNWIQSRGLIASDLILRQEELIGGGSFIRRLQIRSDQSLSRVRLSATPWIAARQASLSITNSQSSLRLTSIESVMPSEGLDLLFH